MSNIAKIRLFIFVCYSLCFSVSGQAEEPKQWIGATFGASYEYGQLGDSGMGLQNRSMNAQVFELLLGYRPNPEWLIGVEATYRIQHQLSSLDSSGGTNLAGKGYWIGLGAKRNLSPNWSLQGAVGLTGRYDFDRQTDQQQDDHLHSPVSLRFKGQYFFRQDWPLSVDSILDYQTWSKFHVSGVDHSQPAQQWMIGIGLTYHFGGSEPMPDDATLTGEK